MAADESAAGARLRRDFMTPPEATKPRCYWYWMDSNMSKTGITHDLEAMRRFGIGEAYIGIIGGQSGIAAGDTKVLSEPFWDMLTHTIREGSRVGVNIGVFNSPGWSQSGGPWVKPGQAMRYISLLETKLHGPQAFEGKLPLPVGAFQDIDVLAFPAPLNDADSLAAHAPKISATPPVADASHLFDGDIATTCTLGGGQVIVELAEPFTARSLIIHPARTANLNCELQVSDDGQQFRTVRSFGIDRHNAALNVGPLPMAPVSVAFPATTGRFFRFNFSGGCTLGEICLSAAPRVESYAEKQLIKVFQDPQPPFDHYSWPAQVEPETSDLAVNPAQVLNLSKQMGPDGALRWNVPAGDWVVLRAVALPTCVSNSPAPPEGTGLEVDKMSRTALKTHFDAYMGELLRRLPPGERKAWKHVVADSYETGPQNWTDDLLPDFQIRYGYDAQPFLPVLTGRIVGSADRSNRFLWDLRRMIADRISKDYVGGLRELCHHYGMRMWLENYGHWGFPGEFLQYGGECDEVSGEFWATGTLGSIELRDASSAAHIYGKPVVFAEAFTGGPLFTSHPYSLKAREDWAYCEGINQFTLHLYIEQPWDDRRPGVSAPFGTEFNRHNTWFESGKTWVDYQRRCSVLLQHGHSVADVAYFIGEDTPKMTGQRKPELPPGYSFDYINADVIEKRLRVKNGRFVLPDGLSYSVLVLPSGTTMRPALLGKIRDLVAAGGVVFGEPPTRSPSLQDYPRCDAEVAKIAHEVWGNCDGKVATTAQFGRGRVFRGSELAPVLAQLGVPPDLSGIDPGKMLFTHRSAPGAEIYFLCNQTAQPADVTPTFRICGLAPEVWRADTGEVERPAVFDSDGSSLRLPLHLDPVGSVFVVFREKSRAQPIVKVLRDGKPVLDATVSSIVPAEAPSSGAFTMAVWAKPGAGTPLFAEANRGVIGISDHRNELIAPQHGGSFGPDNIHAGAGLSVGTNGVTVFEHAGSYFAPILVYAAPLQDWTHVAVVYRAGQPTLFLNGVSVHTGLKSDHTVHPSEVGAGQTQFIGESGPVCQLGRALDESALRELAKAMPRGATDAAGKLCQVSRLSHGEVEMLASEPGAYTFVMANGRRQTTLAPAPPVPLQLGPWNVTFPADSGISGPLTLDPLVSWTGHSDPRVKYFSGTAVYRTRFETPPDWIANDKALFLDLGRVEVIAEVILNGRALGSFWKPPFRTPVQGFLKAGTNELEVRVVNVWHNRLVGQLKEPQVLAGPGVFQPVVMGPTGCNAQDPLFPSGLIGPVTVRAVPLVRISAAKSPLTP